MSNTTTNMSLAQAIDGDNAKTYLETNLANSLTTIDTHDHSTNSKGLAIGRLAATVISANPTTISTGGIVISTGGLTVTAGGLVVTAGGIGITAGNLGVNAGATANVGIQIAGAISGSAVTQTGVASQATFPSTTTTQGDAFEAQVITAASAFTMTTATNFHSLAMSKGAGSTITTANGLLIDALSVGGTNNYGVNITAPSGGSGENLAIKAAGDSVFGTTGIANGATTGFIFIPVGGGTPTGVPTYTGGHIAIRFSSADNKLYAYINGGWKASGAFA